MLYSWQTTNNGRTNIIQTKGIFVLSLTSLATFVDVTCLPNWNSFCNWGCYNCILWIINFEYESSQIFIAHFFNVLHIDLQIFFTLAFHFNKIIVLWWYVVCSVKYYDYILFKACNTLYTLCSLAHKLPSTAHVLPVTSSYCCVGRAHSCGGGDNNWSERSACAALRRSSETKCPL